jgi:hypothetical protein
MSKPLKAVRCAKRDIVVPLLNKVGSLLLEGMQPSCHWRQLQAWTNRRKSGAEGCFSGSITGRCGPSQNLYVKLEMAA